MYLLTWREFSLRCQGLYLKYQRLSVLTRQLAAVIINSTPGVKEAVKETDIFLTAFDPVPEPPKQYTADEWQAEADRLNNQFDKYFNNGKS